MHRLTCKLDSWELIQRGPHRVHLVYCHGTSSYSTKHAGGQGWERCYLFGH